MQISCFFYFIIYTHVFHVFSKIMSYRFTIWWVDSELPNRNSLLLGLDWFSDGFEAKSYRSHSDKITIIYHNWTAWIQPSQNQRCMNSEIVLLWSAWSTECFLPWRTSISRNAQAVSTTGSNKCDVTRWCVPLFTPEIKVSFHKVSGAILPRFRPPPV